MIIILYQSSVIIAFIESRRNVKSRHYFLLDCKTELIRCLLYKTFPVFCSYLEYLKTWWRFTFWYSISKLMIFNETKRVLVVLSTKAKMKYHIAEIFNFALRFRDVVSLNYLIQYVLKPHVSIWYLLRTRTLLHQSYAEE